MEAALPAYEIGGELGRGAFGIVYRGRHRQLHRDVAIKQLPRALAADPEVQRRFLIEARTAAGLQHRNIVQVYDFVERDGLCLLILELIEGGTMAARITAGDLSHDEAVRIVTGVLDGLAYAHDAGVIHRDVKPDNVMLTPDGSPKLGDFGIAKIVAADPNATAAGVVLGTPAYLAPEVAAGNPATPASDIYSCAAMLYEGLSGTTPHPGKASVASTLVAIVNDPPVPLTEAAPEVDPQLAAIVMRALDKDPAQRPTSAAEFAHLLRSAGGGRSLPPRADDLRATIAPRGVAPVAAPAPPKRRRRWLVPAAAAAVIGVVGAVGVLALGGDDTPQAGDTTVPTTSVVPTSISTPDTSVASTDPADTSGSPAGQYVAALATFKAGCGERGVSTAQCECMIRGITDRWGQPYFIRVTEAIANDEKVGTEVLTLIDDCLISTS